MSLVWWKSIENKEVTIELVSKIYSANYCGDITAHLHQDRQKVELTKELILDQIHLPHPPWGTARGLMRPHLFKRVIMRRIGLLSFSKYYHGEFAAAHHSIWRTRGCCLQSIYLVRKEFAKYFLDTTAPSNSSICYQYAVIIKSYISNRTRVR